MLFNIKMKILTLHGNGVLSFNPIVKCIRCDWKVVIHQMRNGKSDIREIDFRSSKTNY